MKYKMKAAKDRHRSAELQNIFCVIFAKCVLTLILFLSYIWKMVIDFDFNSVLKETNIKDNATIQNTMQ